jgi:hypothetical protein
MADEFGTLLLKGAVVIVSPDQVHEGYCSTYFIITKGKMGVCISS